jgi:uncharacterized phage-associated protein
MFSFGLSMFQRSKMMPGWSTEIANELIRLGSEQGRSFDQMQLQKLVYIAHGWCLAITGEPLTGDRPEAWSIGPIYRRLADSLARQGTKPMTSSIDVPMALAAAESVGGSETIPSDSEAIALDVLERVTLNYGALSSSQLSALTRGANAPWATVYESGKGQFREIAHSLIRDQFVRFAQTISDGDNHG